MSSKSDTESDNGCQENHLTIKELESWKVVDLKTWLEKHKLKKSGNKNVLVKRVYKAMVNCQESDTDELVACEEGSENVVPFHLVSHPWKILDSGDIPEITENGVDKYFMKHKNPLTGDQMKFDRQMKKAKRLCNEGFIKDITFNKVDEECRYCYIKSNCLPSMRQTVQIGNTGKTAKFYSLHVCLGRKTGYIYSAHCNCKAGEAGLCAHVGALLYTLVKTKSACTSNECVWDRPRPIEKKPSPKRIKDIDFVKTEKNLSSPKLRPLPGVYKAGPCKEANECSNTFLNELLDGLTDVYPECVLYQTLRCEFSNVDEFINLFEPPFMYRDGLDFKSTDLDCEVQFKSFLQNLRVSKEISEALEIATRGQNCNQNWRSARTCLVTASVMGEVVKREKKEPDNLVKKICGYVSVPNTVKSISYGQKHEATAISSYTRKHMEQCGDVKVELRGLLVNPKWPFLGASIDGLVTCIKCGKGLVEVKCPYGRDNAENIWRNMHPGDCGKDKQFFCNVDNGQLKLKKTHNYMYQIQGQLAIYELDWVDFVVWTKKGVSIERIDFNKDMWSEMLPKLKNFYEYGVIPEIYSRRVKRGISLY